MSKLIIDVLEESVKKYADIPAVKWLKKKDICERSYKELTENYVAVRKGLKAEGFTGKHIAIIGTSSVEWMESYLGLITGQTVAVPLDAGLPAEDLIDLINRSDSEALFLTPKGSALIEPVLKNCPLIKKIWILTEDEFESDNEKVVAYTELKKTGQNADSDSDRPADEDIATIIFTSGTTGKSKGVMLTQSNLATNVESVSYVSDPGTKLLSVLPIHHAFCLVMDWLKGFSLGTTVCINDSLLHMV